MGFLVAPRGQRERLLREELDRAVEVLKNRGVEKIILFGSLAAGEVGPGSDIDLLVVERTDKSFADRLEAVYSALMPRVAMDVLVYTPEEMHRLSSDRAFVRLALKRGRVLYER